MKLRHLNVLSEEKVDLTSIVEELLQVKKVRWYHTLRFIKVSKNLLHEVEDVRKIDPKKVEENPDCKIHRPESIDQIALGAMIELQVLFQNPGDKKIGDLFIQCISLSCYESHTKQKFDSETQSYKNFVKEVSNMDLLDAFGLFNWIDGQINKSVEFWNNQFRQVQVLSQEWEQAGGDLMDKFSVLNNIKSVCKEFNLSYYEALQMEYSLTQVSQFSRMTLSFVEDQMSKNIEAQMKIQRGTP